jgi:hopene-associated glycosyltransferase HpnB
MLRTLMESALQEQRAMVSLMARLATESFWEKLLIAAFLYFFKLLYPFRRVNDPKCKIAAAAGGCILLKREALEAAGGIACIQDAIIDDIALARAVKGKGLSISLCVAPDLLSIRQYQTLGEIWHMVMRTAFTELKYSYVRLFLCVVAMVFTFIVPILGVLGYPALWMGGGEHQPAYLWAWGVAVASYCLICTSYYPTVRYLRLPALFLLSLPLAASLYLLMTLHSAWRYTRGVRSAWKGRKY